MTPSRGPRTALRLVCPRAAVAVKFGLGHSITMAFDISLQEFDLRALEFNNIFHNIAN